MENLNQFLADLNSLGVKLWLEESETDPNVTPRLRYSAPKGTMNSALLSELKTRKTNIVEFLQQRSQNQDLTAQVIKPVPRDQDLPLSFPQQRLWLLEQLEESSSTYNWVRMLRFQGSLNLKLLEASINEIVRRHEVLRTAFVEVDGTPLQKICQPQPVNIQLVELENVAEENKFQEAQNLATKEQSKPFDLQSGLLIKVSLIQLEPEDYVLVLTLHHMVTDGEFISILLQELTTLYQAFCEDKPSPLSELPIQYADFAYWQRQHLQGETLQKLVNYWKPQLAGVTPLLELPTDRPRPPIQTFSGRREWVLFNLELTNKLKSLTEQSGATLFMTLLTAFAILLYRYSGQSDIVIGSPVANRNPSEVEGLIGFFFNSLALRVKISENATFSELLSEVKKVVLDGYEHQDLPVEKLLEELQLENNLNYSPLFQTRFVLQNTPKEKLELSNLKITELEPENVVTKFDLTLKMVELESGLAGGFEYNTDLFDAATIKRMTGHFQTLLEGIVTNPDQKIDLLPLITTAEKQQILKEWNDEPVTYNLCIHQLFTTQVNRTPEAIAVKFEQEEITYQELNNRANQLAHYLQELGVQPETKVGIYLQRSPEAIIAVLATLKAGGAYVPLDPNYPSPRLEWMLSDSQVKVLVTTELLQAKLPENQAKVVCLDLEQEKIATYPQTNPQNQVKPKNLAYIIYTSDSTGNPKGVMIEHHSLASFSCSAIAEYQINSQDKVLQFASLSSDIAVEEIYPCLITGSTLVLRTEEMLNSVPTFVAKCQEWGITVLDLSTAYWNQLTHELISSNLTLPETIRLIIFGGEAVSPETLKLWLENIGEYPQLINAYGTTETTVKATTYKFNPSVGGNGYSPLPEIPIGKPIANAQVYILDKNLQPVPIGIPGEIYIGGTGVARGYLNGDDLTQQKFIPTPVGSVSVSEEYETMPLEIHSSQQNNSQSRLYKTGDLGKYLPDGNIKYLERIDTKKSFDKKIPPSKTVEAPNIEQVPNILPQKETVNHNSPIIPIQPQGNKTPLFCVHSGYGEILLYQNLAFRLDPDRPVYGLLPKEADGNIAGVSSIEEMAAYYVKEIQAMQPNSPYLLAGACIGGTIAIEMARQLKAQGKDAPLVAVFGTAPLNFVKSPSNQSQSVTKNLAIKEKLNAYLDFLKGLTPRERLLHLADKSYEKIDDGLYSLKKLIEPYKYQLYNKLEKPFSQDLQRFHVYVMNSQAQDNFEQKTFDGNLISFWASLDQRFSLAEQLSWSNVVTGEIKLYDLPATHIELALNSSSVQNIADTLREELDTAETNIKSNKKLEQQDIVSQLQEPTSWSSLIPIQPNGSKPPLFCIHGSEEVNLGEPLYAYDLARNFDSDQPIYGLRAVGLDGNSIPLNTIEDMANRYLTEIRGVYPSGQYLLLGLEIGGLVALEMAQKLLEQGEQVPLLMMINTVNPNSDLLSAKGITGIANYSIKLRKSFVKLNQETKCKFTRDFKQNTLTKDLRYFSVEQSLIEAHKKYQTKPYNHKLDIFYSQEIKSNAYWNQKINSTSQIYKISGNSTSIFKQPHIQDLSQKLEKCITESLKEKTEP